MLTTNFVLFLTGSATRFVDQVYKRNACAAHFVSQRGPDASCKDCMHAFTAATGTSMHGSGLSNYLGWGWSTLASTVAGAAGVAYLASRALTSVSA